MTTSSVITVPFCSAGVGAMVMYFETNRPQQREWDREERERYAEAVDAAEIPRRSLVDRALSVAYAAPDWFMSVIFPRVMAGATMGAIAGLIITLPLWALGVIN